MAVFLVLSEKVPQAGKAGDRLSQLFAAVEWMGKPTALAAGSFVAYLVGSLLEIRASAVLRFVQDIAEKHMKPSMRTRWLVLTPSGFNSLSTHMRKAYGSGVNPGERTLECVLADLPEVRDRLYGADKDLFADYDRMNAEADLKVNAGFAFMVLSITAYSMLGSVNWLLLLEPALFLIWRGFRRVRRANDVLVQAIVVGAVRISTLEAFRRPTPDEEDRSGRR
ncbi:hypothetical protein ACFPM3_04150 [Streptomyces coeruleoprunus]|uniref:ABC transmembrane type-1 domain-containing protein n=1 Tax=Streptomyces coeruleoprunus TaxID=285563 RepID=A0ABV9X7B5_9ACTN